MGVLSTSLPQVSAVADTDEVIVNASGVTSRITTSNIRQSIISDAMASTSSLAVTDKFIAIENGVAKIISLADTRTSLVQGGASTIVSANLTPSLVMASNDSGKASVSSVPIATLNTLPKISSSYIAQNYIFNGDFRVAVRGIPDAWPHVSYMQYVGTAPIAISQDTDIPTFLQSGFRSSYSIKGTKTASANVFENDYSLLQTALEGFDYATISGRIVTLSFWVKSGSSGTYCVALRNTGNNRSYVIPYTISAANTWEKKVKTISLSETGGTWNYTNGTGIKIGWVLAAGTAYRTATSETWLTGNYIATNSQLDFVNNGMGAFYLSQASLTLGDMPQEFFQKNIAEERERCSRWIYRSQPNGPIVSGYASAGSQTISQWISYPTEMRTAVAPTISGTWALTNCTGPTIGNYTAQGYELVVTSSAAGVVKAAPNSADDYVETDATLY